jgi:hypothetical protein
VACFQSNLAAGLAALEEIPAGRIVIEKPQGVIMKLAYYFTLGNFAKC